MAKTSSPNNQETELSKNINSLDFARKSIKPWLASGVVKSVKLYSARDGKVCDECQKCDGKIYPITTPQEIAELMNHAKVKGCTNHECRCYWRPEDISIN